MNAAHDTGRMLAAVAAAWFLAASCHAEGRDSCTASEIHRSLDFWVGAWEVRVDGQIVGHNRIEKTAGECALVEHWKGVSGGVGTSLFWVDPESEQWRQVWVTDNPLSRGGTKEKAQVPAPGGAVRLQGEIPLPAGGSYLDRTTLTPGEDGTVRQLIEISTDGGDSWRPVFDAEYRRKAGEG